MNDKGVDLTSAAQIAYLSNGNLQSAQQLLIHQENDYHELLRTWFGASWKNNGLKIVELSEGELAKMGRENQKNFLRYGINLMRECMLFMAETPGLIHLPEKELEFISKFSQILNLAKAEAIAEELEKAHYHIERNANPKILFLDVSLKLVKILKFNTLPQGTHNILL
jgi:DNA polymerase-3 subunit delta'